MQFMDVMSLMRQITMQRMLERDDFTKRIKKETPIYLHECLYPLMQGRDSVEIKSDIELGGSEQLFSLMVGRDLQKDAGQEPQVCITLPLLLGLDGQKKMGKSLGNHVGVGEKPDDQFAKVMSIADTLLKEWFLLLTDRTNDEIAGMLADPMQAKKTLGQDIVRLYHGEQAAIEACAEWVRQKSLRQDPTEIPVVEVSASELADGKIAAFKLLVVLGLTKSNNDARRAIQAGSVTIGPDKTKIDDPMANIDVTDSLIVRVGKRQVVRVKIK
jgi:tyrosyl-tRNA synthetase